MLFYSLLYLVFLTCFVNYIHYYCYYDYSYDFIFISYSYYFFLLFFFFLILFNRSFSIAIKWSEGEITELEIQGNNTTLPPPPPRGELYLSSSLLPLLRHYLCLFLYLDQ